MSIKFLMNNCFLLYISRFFRVLRKKNLPSISDGWGVGTIDKYDILTQVGEGTYGQVYKALERSNSEFYSIQWL